MVLLADLLPIQGSHGEVNSHVIFFHGLGGGPHKTWQAPGVGNIFEEKQRVSFHQPSRIKGAHKLLQLFTDGSLKVFNSTVEIDEDLAIDVGEELALMLAESQVMDGDIERQKIVIRSNPVHRIDSLMTEEVDLSMYSSHLCSCLALVKKLKQKGLLTLEEEALARSYLSLVEKEWPHEPAISDGANLYLDDLSVSYLQHTGLLEKLHLARLDIYISSGIKEESNTLVCYEQLTIKVSDIIESIRNFLATGIQNKKIKVGALSDYDKSEDPSIQGHPIKEQLSETVLQPGSFTILMNSALIYRLDSDQAQLAAIALRAAKHQLRKVDNKELLFSILKGLATVAAVTRSKDLAGELIILDRRSRGSITRLSQKNK